MVWVDALPMRLCHAFHITHIHAITLFIHRIQTRNNSINLIVFLPSCTHFFQHMYTIHMMCCKYYYYYYAMEMYFFVDLTTGASFSFYFSDFSVFEWKRPNFRFPRRLFNTYIHVVLRLSSSRGTVNQNLMQNLCCILMKPE